MRAVVVETFREPPRVVEVPDPQPPAHGVVVAVSATGVCRSDWHAWQGHDPDVTLPHVPGHELAGTVVAVGAEDLDVLRRRCAAEQSAVFRILQTVEAAIGWPRPTSSPWMRRWPQVEFSPVICSTKARIGGEVGGRPGRRRRRGYVQWWATRRRRREGSTPVPGLGPEPVAPGMSGSITWP
jgi:hypothetical protein